MILFLKEFWGYPLVNSIALIETCIDKGYLEIISKAQLYDIEEEKT